MRRVYARTGFPVRGDMRGAVVVVMASGAGVVAVVSVAGVDGAGMWDCLLMVRDNMAENVAKVKGCA